LSCGYSGYHLQERFDVERWALPDPGDILIGTHENEAMTVGFAAAVEAVSDNR
jgi:hypothetical protein